jgi:hypothetical protein
MRHDDRTRPFPPLPGRCRPSATPIPLAPPPSTRPAPYRTPDPIFLSHRRDVKWSWAPSCHPFPFSPSLPFPLRVKLVVAHYTPPRCLLSKPGHRSIPEAVGRHHPPTVEVLALMSRSGRPPVPLSRRRAQCWLPSPPQPQADASKVSSGWTSVSPSAPTMSPWRRRSIESRCRLPCPATSLWCPGHGGEDLVDREATGGPRHHARDHDAVTRRLGHCAAGPGRRPEAEPQCGPTLCARSFKFSFSFIISKICINF